MNNLTKHVNEENKTWQYKNNTHLTNMVGIKDTTIAKFRHCLLEHLNALGLI